MKDETEFFVFQGYIFASLFFFFLVLEKFSSWLVLEVISLTGSSVLAGSPI